MLGTAAVVLSQRKGRNQQRFAENFAVLGVNALDILMHFFKMYLKH